VVRLAGQEYALDAAWVRGAMQLRGQTLLPVRSFGPFRHVVCVDGRMIAVASPHLSLGLPTRPASARSALVLIEPPAGKTAGPLPPESHPFALLVDSLSRLDRLKPVNFRHENRPDGPQARVCLNGKWRPLLDLNSLFPPHHALQAANAFLHL
jgi:chemotaxis signal transduction protein